MRKFSKTLFLFLPCPRISAQQGLHLACSKISFVQNTAYQNSQLVIFGETTFSSLKKNARFFIDCHGSSVILLIFTCINLMDMFICFIYGAHLYSIEVF